MLIKAAVVAMIAFNTHILWKTKGEPNWGALILTNVLVFGGAFFVASIIR